MRFPNSSANMGKRIFGRGQSEDGKVNTSSINPLKPFSPSLLFLKLPPHTHLDSDADKEFIFKVREGQKGLKKDKSYTFSLANPGSCMNLERWLNGMKKRSRTPKGNGCNLQSY